MLVLWLLCASLLSWVRAAEDPTQGLGCKTEGGFTYCEGKSDQYNKFAEAEGGGGLDTRSNSGLLNRNYGMREASVCDQNFGGKCQSLSAAIVPTYLVNNRNEARYILQVGAVQQPIQLAICTGRVCGQYGFCEQNYVNVQLLSWNPYDQYPTLIVDVFQIPSCCQCKRGGSKSDYGSWSWN